MNETSSKPWYASRGVWGGVVTLLAVALGVLGYEVEEAEAQALVELAAGIAGAVGGILAIVGRIKARKPIAAIVLLLATAPLATACGFTPEGQAVREAIAVKGAAAFDAGLENAEWFICQAASVGSVRRRYGGSAGLADAYRNLCERGSTELLFRPTPPGAR
jgi:hypothetical protein